MSTPPNQTSLPAESPTPLDPYYAQICRQIGEYALEELLARHDDLTLDEARQKALEVALMMRRQAEDITAFLNTDVLPPRTRKPRKK